jgi:HK97 family phage major capsid protein
VSQDGMVQTGWGREERTEERATGMSEGNAPSAGFLVGTDRVATLIERVYDVGSLLGRVAMDPISSGSNSMVYYAEDETSRANGYRRGGIRAYWAAEAGTVTASAPKFREVELKLMKAMALVYATSEMLADAATLESYIMRNLPEELRFLVENAVVNGTGAGQPLGIMGSSALISVAKETGQAADTVVAQNVIKMFARMWTRGLRNGIWLMSGDVWPQLFQMVMAVGTGGVPVFLPPGGMSVAPYGSLLGRPIEPVEYCPVLGDLGDLVFFDPSQYQMINKGGVQTASSIHVKFVYDESCFRFIWRVNGAPLWNAALTPFNGGATVSPFVGLAARA